MEKFHIQRHGLPAFVGGDELAEVVGALRVGLDGGVDGGLSAVGLGGAGLGAGQVDDALELGLGDVGGEDGALCGAEGGAGGGDDVSPKPGF